MKSIQKLSIMVVLVILTSCVSKIKFPVSQITPAADISAKIKKQEAPNYQVSITANNLANSERLEPSKKIYVIWATSEAGITRNAGHFTHKNAEKATYKSSFPYKPIEIFITAEDDEGVCQPTGIEITRAKL
jgi:Flp pilus assembly protein CpaB